MSRRFEKKTIFLIILTIISSLILFVTQVKASTIFEDNFNTYNDGELVGQGAWDGDNTIFSVEGTEVFEGEKAVYWSNNSGTAKAVFTIGDNPVPDGRIVVYFKKSNATPKVVLDIENVSGGSISTVNLKNNGKWEIYTTEYVEQGNYPDNVWFPVEIEWRSSDGEKRYRVNEGSWTDWVVSESTASPRRLAILTISGDNVGYFDYISENLYEEVPTPTPTALETIFPMGGTFASLCLAYIRQLATDLMPVIILLLGLFVGFWSILWIEHILKGGTIDNFFDPYFKGKK